MTGPDRLGLGFLKGDPRYVVTWHGQPIAGLRTWTQYFTDVFAVGDVVLGIAREGAWADVVSNFLLIVVDAASGTVLDSLELDWWIDIGDDHTHVLPGDVPRWSIYFGRYYTLELVAQPRIDLITWALGFTGGTERLRDVLRKRRLILRWDPIRAPPPNATP
jgi:hypothetical protein